MAIPSTAIRFTGTMDPGDWRPFELDLSALLDTANDEQIDPANYTLSMSAEGALLGVQMDASGDRAPALIDEGTAIRFYLSVASLSQANVAFDNGVDVAITVNFQTTAAIFNRFERTCVVRVVNR